MPLVLRSQYHHHHHHRHRHHHVCCFCLFGFLFVWVFLVSLFNTGSHCVTLSGLELNIVDQAGLELIAIHLSLPPCPAIFLGFIDFFKSVSSKRRVYNIKCRRDFLFKTIHKSTLIWTKFWKWIVLMVAKYGAVWYHGHDSYNKFSIMGTILPQNTVNNQQINMSIYY